MSKLTEVLKLFCYDPETDGANTFNIPKALNENWEKIDQLVLLAVAAAADYNPSGTYVIGDYCTNDGNLYKCNTPIESGEAWTAEHWMETTVAAELGKKADGFVREIAAGENLDDFVTFGSYFVTLQSAPNVTNMPKNVPIHLYVLRADKMESFRRVLQIAVASNKDNLAIWARRHSDMGWGSWVRLDSTVEVVSLSLADGWTGNQQMTLWKLSSGMVFYSFSIKATAAKDTGETICIVPVGYRPAVQQETCAVIKPAGTPASAPPASVLVNGNGVMYFFANGGLQIDDVLIGSGFYAI